MMSELSKVRSSEGEKETKSQAWRTVGNVALGALLTAGTVAAYSLYELRTMQVSVDPLELDRTISDNESAFVDTTPSPTDIPSLDEVPRENRFLDGLTVTE
jgi:hypothetical protein